MESPTLIQTLIIWVLSIITFWIVCKLVAKMFEHQHIDGVMFGWSGCQAKTIGARMTQANYNVIVNDGDGDILEFDCESLHDVMNTIMDRIDKSDNADELQITVRDNNTDEEI